MKYSLDGGTNWTDITATSVTISSGVTTTNGIQVKRPGDGTTTTDSDAQSITVTKAETPNLAVTQPSAIGGKGSIASTTAHQKSTDNAAWTDCDGAWNNLEAGIYYVRVKATGTALASDAQIITITAYGATQETTPNATFAATGADSGTLSGLTANAAYTVSGAGLSSTGMTADADGKITLVSGLEAGTLSIVKNGNGTTTTDSEAQSITVTQPTAPSAGKADCSTTSNNDGKLTGVTTDMEYRKSDAASWKDRPRDRPGIRAGHRGLCMGGVHRAGSGEG